ncbi:hypothetical protein [uncultured Nocardioides sp.]|uniref:hypothetical protein n=1 Tax=uncultured Nocardioides sp. TaxID=198441 RepID=UPI002631185A|nr:hypothetical protein [uncultured Nocardioides sp.]
MTRALREYDELGGDEFLAKYGFGRATDYLLTHEGQDYDSKAVLGAAQGFATGTPATAEEFSGGRTGAARVLRDLGFEVTDSSSRDSDDVDPAEAREVWAAAARDALIEVAKRYQAVITYSELATQVQRRSGVTTKQPMRRWIGDVLLEVARDNTERSEPALMALAVDGKGQVGRGYATAVETTTGETLAVEDTDDHAAQQRLECHRHFEAVDLPSNGGRAALTPQVARARAALTPSRADRAPDVCPTCNMALPGTGVCDNCG